MKDAPQMNRIEKLEYSLLELGAQMYELKQKFTSLKEIQDNQAIILNNLKKILDEKHVISQEDFEAALELSDLQNAEKDIFEMEGNDEPLPTPRPNKRGFH
ncbi:MAG: hypothetical protein HQK54_07950 [Oligoflexales bacterium]|nr:hypothetical protein [Oligoflexales bacterium]